MKTVLIATACLILMPGCAVSRLTERRVIQESHISVVVRLVSDTVTLCYCEAFSPKDPVVQWNNAEFEILAPTEYAGKKIVIPLTLESTQNVQMERTYSILLPLSLIQGKDSAIGGYNFSELMKNEPNQAPEPTPTAVTPPAGQEARQP